MDEKKQMTLVYDAEFGDWYEKGYPDQIITDMPKYMAACLSLGIKIINTEYEG